MLELALVSVICLLNSASVKVVVLGNRLAISWTSMRVAGKPSNPARVLSPALPPNAPARMRGFASGLGVKEVRDSAVILLTRYFSTSHCLPSWSAERGI